MSLLKPTFLEKVSETIDLALQGYPGIFMSRDQKLVENYYLTLYCVANVMYDYGLMNGSDFRELLDRWETLEQKVADRGYETSNFDRFIPHFGISRSMCRRMVWEGVEKRTGDAVLYAPDFKANYNWRLHPREMKGLPIRVC